MLFLLRIIFGIALVYCGKQVWDSGNSTAAGDIVYAGYFGLCVVLAVINAALWAPYLGDKLADPLTGAITRSTFFEQRNHLMRLIRWFHDRGYRRLSRYCCFLEGVRHPDLPAAFVLGLEDSKPGSWLEKVYAREVYRFENAQNCVKAYEALKRHEIDPGPHRNPQVNMVIMSLERQARPDLPPLPLPSVPPPSILQRNSKIHLFQGAEAGELPEENLADNREGATVEPMELQVKRVPAGPESEPVRLESEGKRNSIWNRVCGWLGGSEKTPQS